jgi:uncharacterized OB-fold protein
VTTVRTVAVRRCADCHSAFLPRPGACPRCGSTRVTAGSVGAAGRALAAVELQYPPPGFAPPHRLVLVELAESIRLLAGSPNVLPAPGDSVAVRTDGERYWLDDPARAE